MALGGFHPAPQAFADVIDAFDRREDFGQPGFIRRAPAKIGADGLDQGLLMVEQGLFKAGKGGNPAIGIRHGLPAKRLLLQTEQLLHTRNGVLLDLHVGNIGYHGNLLGRIASTLLLELTVFLE